MPCKLACAPRACREHASPPGAPGESHQRKSLKLTKSRGSEIFSHQSQTLAQPKLFPWNEFGTLPFRNEISVNKAGGPHCQIETEFVQITKNKNFPPNSHSTEFDQPPGAKPWRNPSIFYRMDWEPSLSANTPSTKQLIDMVQAKDCLVQRSQTSRFGCAIRKYAFSLQHPTAPKCSTNRTKTCIHASLFYRMNLELPRSEPNLRQTRQ